MKTKIIDGWEYTLEDEQKGKKFSDMNIPKGWELWTAVDVIRLYSVPKTRKELYLDDCWFFVKPIHKKNVVWFNAISVGFCLNCYRVLQYSGAVLGVRFKRKAEKKEILP